MLLRFPGEGERSYCCLVLYCTDLWHILSTEPNCMCRLVKATWTHVHSPARTHFGQHTFQTLVDQNLTSTCVLMPWGNTLVGLPFLTGQEVSHRPFMTYWSCGFVWFHVMIEAQFLRGWLSACFLLSGWWLVYVQYSVCGGISLRFIVPPWQTTAGKALTDFKKIRLQEDVMAVLRTFISEQPSVKVGRFACGRRTTHLWPHSTPFCCVCVHSFEEHVILFSLQEPMLRRLKDIRANLERSEFFRSHEVGH